MASFAVALNFLRFRWLSEKMDGIRAYWDEKRLLSRNNKQFEASSYFTSKLPRDFHLDGELWMGRRAFEHTIAKLNANDQDWSGVQYFIFDVPSLQKPFKARIK